MLPAGSARQVLLLSISVWYYHLLLLISTSNIIQSGLQASHLWPDFLSGDAEGKRRRWELIKFQFSPKAKTGASCILIGWYNISGCLCHPSSVWRRALSHGGRAACWSSAARRQVFAAPGKISGGSSLSLSRPDTIQPHTSCIVTSCPLKPLLLDPPPPPFNLCSLHLHLSLPHLSPPLRERCETSPSSIMCIHTHLTRSKNKPLLVAVWELGGGGGGKPKVWLVERGGKRNSTCKEEEEEETEGRGCFTFDL